MLSFRLFLSESQKFKSASTSINKTKLPKGYRVVADHFGWKPESVHLDIGGGKYDNAVEYLSTHGVRGHVWDPFNRSEEHNKKSLEMTGNEKSDTVSLFNVLNVIDDSKEHVAVLNLAHQSLRPDGNIFIGVYEGDKSGVGKQTGNDSYQRNEKLKSYLPIIQSVFPNARMHKGIIHATKTR